MDRSANPCGAKAFRRFLLDVPSNDDESFNSMPRQSEYFGNMDREISIAEDQMFFAMNDPSGAKTLRQNQSYDPSGANDEEDEECQLHNDEEGPIKRKKYRKNNSAIKLKAISYAKKGSIHSAAKKFNVVNIWMSNGDRQELTIAGNPKAPALEVVLDWVDRAWHELSKEVIVKSFKVCALTTSIDGSEDCEIACFKPEGPIGVRGLEVLRKIRSEELGRDGQNDEETACISDEEDALNLENVNDDDLFEVV